MAAMNPIPLEQLPDLMQELPPKYRAVAALGVTTGCRISEITSLRRFDLLDHTGRLKDTIEFQKLKTRGRGPKKRTFSIPPAFRTFIIDFLRSEERKGYDRPDDLVFRGHCGRPLSRFACYRIFMAVLGSGHGTHWMRKTFGHEMFEEYRRSNDDFTAAEYTRRALGHARIDTTIKYLGIINTQIREAQYAVFNNVRFT